MVLEVETMRKTEAQHSQEPDTGNDGYSKDSMDASDEAREESASWRPNRPPKDRSNKLDEADNI